MTKNTWTPQSWRDFPALQMPKYTNEAALNAAEGELSNMPPLIFAGEARRLQNALGEVALGRGFLLQGGDCAESFAEFNANKIRDTFRALLQMSVILTYAGGVPVVKIGRIAGQFAKPRSADFEERNGVKLPSYRGDVVNSLEFTKEAREPDPTRMIKAYNQCASTINLLRAFSKGGYANLSRVHGWNMDFVEGLPQGKRYEIMAQDIKKCLSFMDACGINSKTVPALRETSFYTSHEALLLQYEEALTRQDSTSGDFYDTSSHFLWIGARTGKIDGAHVDFMSGIKNPIGIKASADLEPDKLVRVIAKLNPDNIAGRITVIVRMGSDKIRAGLPPLVKAVEREGQTVVWSIDPMHGNTYTSESGYKTRPFDAILDEVRGFFEVHRALGTHAGGIHIEMTGDNVTECIGGSHNISDEDLSSRYHTHCDPRLNAAQSIELAFLLAEELRK